VAVNLSAVDDSGKRIFVSHFKLTTDSTFALPNYPVELPASSSLIMAPKLIAAT
jgi:hypothetical protein